ncbi:streptophobe family protein [Streptomyces sp. NPDC052396]|uniref:streptophobe family protein n=1 Tax=Streptomyces sp. NPDC052396 TaxID=3365689 RepID=UPI0037D058F0
MTISGSRTVRGTELLLSAVAAVSWAFLAMAAVAALGLHLLGADAVGSLGPMTAALMVLAMGGSVSPSGSVEAFGLQGAGAHTTIDIAPLGVSLVGALLLGLLFARSLRAAGPTVRVRELALRAGVLAVLFLLLLGGLCWAGSSTVTFDGKGLGLGTGGGNGPSLNIPGLGDIGGGLADGLGGLARSKASVGFTVRTGPSLLGGAVWVLAVLLITVLAARRAPLPPRWALLHRSVRPAVSALCAVLVLAVAAGWAAAAVAASHDDHPGRVAGATLLGAPNGVWLGVPLGLLVPWHGSASGSLLRFLPDPLNRLLDTRAEETVSVGRLAELEPRVWLLTAACALLILLAGVLTAVRTPRGRRSVPAFAGRCGLSLSAATALALPLLVLATRLKADAGLSVLGVDAVGAGLDLEGSTGAALALGALWGLAAGFIGALLACATGAAGRRTAALCVAAPRLGVRGDGPGGAAPGSGWGPDAPGYGWEPGTPGYAPGPGAPGQGQGPGGPGHGQGPGPRGPGDGPARLPGYDQAETLPGYGRGPAGSGYGRGPRTPGYGHGPEAAGNRAAPPPGYGPPPASGPSGAPAPDDRPGPAQPPRSGYGPPPPYGPSPAPAPDDRQGPAPGPGPGVLPAPGYGPPAGGAPHRSRTPGFGPPPAPEGDEQPPPGPYRPSPRRPAREETNPYLRPPGGNRPGPGNSADEDADEEGRAR